MLFQDSFSTKFRLLREIHSLSTVQAAEFFSFKSNGSVGMIETGKAGPTLTMLEDTVDFFGVSLDWLFGKSDTIYRPEILLDIEDRITIRGDSGCGWMISYPQYADAEKRQATFSLPVRANIIFCRQVLYKSSMIFSDEKKILGIDFSDIRKIGLEKERSFDIIKQKLYDVLYPLMVGRDGKRRANIRWNLCSSCYDYLQDYIAVADSDKRKRTTPVFDVEAAWRELQKDKE